MKTLHRRAALAAALVLATLSATAQTPAPWPTKPVHIVLPAPAGTAPDIIARLVGEKLGAVWGQPVIVENKPGAGGLIGLSAVKSGEKDDHAFVLAPASVFTLTPYMFPSKQVDVVHDFVPVALLGVGPLMIAVRADSPVKTLADLIALARKTPDTFVMATTAQYSVPHLAAEMLSRAAGVPMHAVPFAGSGQSISAVINGDAQALIDGVPPIDPMIKGKRLKAIAMFSDKRVLDRPQLPTVAENYRGLVVNGWFGVVAPHGTSERVIARVNRDIATVLAMPDVIARFETLGIYPQTRTPAQFGSYWAAELTRWEAVLREVGAQRTMQ